MSEIVEQARSVWRHAEDDWEDARESWRDDMAARFEAEHWEPVVDVMGELIASLDEAMEAIREVDSVCDGR
jgi:transketolase